MSHNIIWLAAHMWLSVNWHRPMNWVVTAAGMRAAPNIGPAPPNS
jgi:hypothetical protein